MNVALVEVRRRKTDAELALALAESENRDSAEEDEDIISEENQEDLYQYVLF